MKKCPYCAEEIQDDAIKCKHCGEWLERKKESASNVSDDKISTSPELLSKQSKVLEEIKERGLRQESRPQEISNYEDSSLKQNNKAHSISNTTKVMITIWVGFVLMFGGLFLLGESWGVLWAYIIGCIMAFLCWKYMWKG